jgi:hypothetical protein
MIFGSLPKNFNGTGDVVPASVTGRDECCAWVHANMVRVNMIHLIGDS